MGKTQAFEIHHFLIQDFFHELGNVLELGLALLHLLLLLMPRQLQVLFGHRDQLHEWPHAILVNRFHHLHQLKAPLQHPLYKDLVT
jgi:hypothetical protein